MQTDPKYVDLRSLSLMLWAGRWTILVTTALGGCIAAVYLLLAQPVYRAEALVMPRQEFRAGSGLTAVAPQFGAFADIAGLSLGPSGDRAIPIATLKSRGLIESFISENNLLPKLYESRWDAEAGTWETSDQRKIPTVWQAYNDFVDDILHVSEDRKTGLVTVAVDWKDAAEAQRWVSDLVARTNAHLKAEAILEAEKNLSYLDEQTRKIGLVELRQSLFTLVEAEMRKLMIAKGRDEFAIRTIDKAVVPKKRIRPRRTAIALLGLIIGLLLGSTIAVGGRLLNASQL